MRFSVSYESLFTVGGYCLYFSSVSLSGRIILLLSSCNVGLFSLISSKASNLFFSSISNSFINFFNFFLNFLIFFYFLIFLILRVRLLEWNHFVSFSLEIYFDGTSDYPVVTADVGFIEYFHVFKNIIFVC